MSVIDMLLNEGFNSMDRVTHRTYGKGKVAGWVNKSNRAGNLIPVWFDSSPEKGDTVGPFGGIPATMVPANELEKTSPEVGLYDVAHAGSAGGNPDTKVAVIDLDGDFATLCTLTVDPDLRMVGGLTQCMAADLEPIAFSGDELLDFINAMRSVYSTSYHSRGSISTSVIAKSDYEKLIDHLSQRA